MKKCPEDIKLIKIYAEYKNEEWIYDQYRNQEKSTVDIGKELYVSSETIRRWLIKFNIPRRSRGETELGNKNSLWKGKNAGYGAIHAWIRRYKPKKEVCEICNKKRKLELSSKTHEYNRDIDEYRWLCRSCHRKYDYEKGFENS